MKKYARRQHYLQQQASPTIGRSRGQAVPSRLAVHPILQLQRTIGNQAVLRRHAPQARSLQPAQAVQQQMAQASIQRQPKPGGPLDPGGVYDQIDIVREAILPLDLYRQRDIRKLSFGERQTLEFQRKLAAIGELGEMRNERGVKVLIEVVEDKLPAIKDYNPDQKRLLRAAAVEALGKIGGQVALAKLNDLLNSQDPQERSLAARGLSGTSGGQAVTTLLARLKTEAEADVKVQIIAALGNIGSGSLSAQEKQAIVTDLIREMENNTGQVKLAAIDALGQLRLKTATDPLLKQLKLWLSAEDITSAIARALGEIRDPQAVDLLVILLEKHGAKFVRAEAAAALGKIGGPKAVAALQKQLAVETDADVKAKITKALP